MAEQKKKIPTCPFCDETDVIDKGKTEGKPDFNNRWQCNKCDLTFETENFKGEGITYLSTKGKYLTIDEFKIWGKEYYKNKVYKDKTSLSAKIKKYQYLTNDMKYNGVLEAIKKIK